MKKRTGKIAPMKTSHIINREVQRWVMCGVDSGYIFSYGMLPFRFKKIK